MKLLQKTLIIAILVLSFGGLAVVAPGRASAQTPSQDTTPTTSTTTAPTCKTETLPDGTKDKVCSGTDPATQDCSRSSGDCDIVGKYINPLIVTLSILVGIAVTIGIIWGGVQVSMSAGDPQKNALGRKHIQDALIALVTYILFYTFLNWIVPGGI